MARITDLPVELVLQISACWGDSALELSSLSRCSRLMHWLTFDQLFRKAFQRRCTRDEPHLVFMKLVFHAIKRDSQHIAQWLCHHELSRELNGFVPSDSDSTKTVTYLHLSIIGDAPRVANHLVRYGTDVWEGGGDYPDINPLYLAIANPRGVRNLDGALRIACSYALPRTCRYLLTRGADPNSPSRFGLAAIHLAVRNRLPWRNFDSFATCINGGSSSFRWRTALTRTVAVLLRFGADPNLRSATSRDHFCGQKCWRSPDCEHRGQGVLHYACSGGPKQVVSLLIKHGADPKIADDDGYLPIFSALCHDNRDVALQLLNNDIEAANPMVIQQHQSTTLHIACRFASLEVVLVLLERGADANATDLFGQTPLHELLSQGCWELEDRILKILPLLDTYGAVADFRAQEGMTARQMATTHPLPSVRQFFDPADIDHRESESFQIQRCELGGPSTDSQWGSSKPVNRRQGKLPETYSRESFPFLNRPPARQDGIKQAPKLDSVWLDKKKTDRLRIQPPPSANQQRNRGESGSRKGVANSVAGRSDGRKPSPAVTSEEGSRMSASAAFWGSLSSSAQQKPRDQKAELAQKERKDNEADGVVRRGKRMNKWAPLDLL